MSWSLQFPGVGGEEDAIVVGGGSVTPSPEYILLSYLPFILVQVVAPLVGLTLLWLRALRRALEGKPLTRPPGTLYSVYMIAGVAPLAGGALILHKLILDYVYGYAGVSPWRFIWTALDWERYMYVASLLSKTHYLAGLGLGLTTLLVLNRKSYENWLIDAAIYAGNLALYLVLAPRPLREFKYSSAYIQAFNITPGTRPYEAIAASLNNMLLAGLALGLALSITTIIIARTRRQPKR